MALFTVYRAPGAVQQSVAAAGGRLRHLLHNEALGGAFLLLAAAAALALANSSWHQVYENFLHMPLALGIGAWRFYCDVHFLVNDVLMTVFFLAAGVEIRQEIHDGALAAPKQAVLPVIAACGGVCLPALIYLGFNAQTAALHGWAVPTATDIAFAVGILALLGKAIPANLRIILLSLAIIDDIIAVLIIAFFYSGGLSLDGGAVAAAAIALILLLQFLGLASVLFYIAAGAVLWLGLWRMGVHPSLAGVILGLLTPAVPLYDGRLWRKKLGSAAPLLAAAAKKSGKAGGGAAANENAEIKQALASVRQLAVMAEPPVKRVREALHLWVTFGIMPLFAFANAGVRLSDVDFSQAGSAFIFLGVLGGLVLGKPLGVLAASFLAVKCGLCRLPPQLGWGGMALVGLLAGIGFTMAIFVAMLAFTDKAAVSAAVLGVLSGSALSAALGLAYGLIYRRNLPAAA